MTTQIHNSRRHGAKERGLSLIELLVSLVITTMILAGVLQVFVSSKQSYRTEEELARMQENARYAVGALSRDVRLTGFAGCSGSSTSLITPSVKAAPVAPTFHFVDGRSIVGLDEIDNGSIDMDGDGTGDIVSVVSGTDAFIINSAAECSSPVVTPMVLRTEDIIVSDSDGCDWEADQYAIITDCQALDVFRISANSFNAKGRALGHGTAGGKNTKAKLSSLYDSNSMVFSYKNVAYFIKVNTDTGQNALYRKINAQTPELVVDGVENMQIRYGYDDNGDYVVDELRTATQMGAVTSADWANIISVEINLLLVSEGDNLIPSSQSFVFNGKTYNDASDANSVATSDRKIRHVVRKNIGMRSLSL